MYSSTNGLIDLEESSCQATKRSNRGFVDARFLWVEGLITNEESQFQNFKILDSYGERVSCPLRNPSSVNGTTKKAFTKSMYL
jgi:hypothetical protein